MSIKGKTLRVNGIDINVAIEGEGPAVFLLHGFPDSSALWRDVMPVLVEAGYQVIAPDQRGFGESDAPLGVKQYRMVTIVSDAITVLDALGISKAHLVAHDWGAIIGWTLAGQHGERFYSERLVDNSFRYERVDDCSHWIPLDEPQRVAALLLGFFEEQNGRTWRT